MTINPTPYKSPGREAVGQAMVDFLTNNLRNRFACRGLCLPAEANAEARRFMDAGFRLDNIWGVERCAGKALQQASLESGIHLFHGSLGEFPGWLTRNHPEIFFDACAIDLSGMLHTYSEEVRQIFPIMMAGSAAQPRCLVLTSFASRDAHAVAEGNCGITFIRALLQGKVVVADTLEQLRIEHQYIVRRHIKRPDQRIPHELYWAREFGLLWFLIHAIGSFQWANGRLEPNQAFIDRADELMAALRQAVNRDIIYLGRYATNIKNIRPRFINDFRLSEFANLPAWFWPDEIKRFAYVSGHTPRMKQWFVRFRLAGDPSETKPLGQVAGELCQRLQNTRLVFYDRRGQKISYPSHCGELRRNNG